MTQLQRRNVRKKPARPRLLTASLLPGLALATVGTAIAMTTNRVLPAVSPLLVAIILGAVLANVWRVPQSCTPGVRFVAKPVLRMGIALLGLQLLLSDIFALGWQVVALVVVIVGAGIGGTLWAGSVMGVSRAQSLLIACGFSICGAAAVAAAEDVADADEEEVLTAVALVVLFGTLMIALVPLGAALFGLGEHAAGMWAGGSIHEVAQVVAAGGILGGTALAVATVVKLARVLMLAPVIAILGLVQRRGQTAGTSTRRPPLIPLFIIGFLGCVALRSSGVVPATALSVAGVIQTTLLSAAMFALGLGVRLASLRSVGARPIGLATASTVWVATVALVGVLLVVPGATT